jgi:hypothetical protein
MTKFLRFLRKNYIYLIVAAGYLQWCSIAADVFYTNFHLSFKLLVIGLGFFGWYLIYIRVRKSINRSDDESSEE